MRPKQLETNGKEFGPSEISQFVRETFQNSPRKSTYGRNLELNLPAFGETLYLW
jgi:hypothetical protein